MSKFVYHFCTGANSVDVENERDCVELCLDEALELLGYLNGGMKVASILNSLNSSGSNEIIDIQRNVIECIGTNIDLSMVDTGKQFKTIRYINMDTNRHKTLKPLQSFPYQNITVDCGNTTLILADYKTNIGTLEVSAVDKIIFWDEHTLRDSYRSIMHLHIYTSDIIYEGEIGNIGELSMLQCNLYEYSWLVEHTGGIDKIGYVEISLEGMKNATVKIPEYTKEILDSFSLTITEDIEIHIDLCGKDCRHCDYPIKITNVGNAENVTVVFENYTYRNKKDYAGIKVKTFGISNCDIQWNGTKIGG